MKCLPCVCCEHPQSYIVNFSKEPSLKKRQVLVVHFKGAFLLLRKEVIQPHLPIRLPCYDFTLVIDLTFDGSLLAVKSPASGAPNFRVIE